MHGDQVDPNALLLVWRDEAERKAKAEGLPATFLRGRQEALERYSREVSAASDAKLSEFYANKLKENGGLLALLEGKGDSTEVQNKAKALWHSVGETLAYLEAQLDVKAPFLLGDQVSLAECVSSFPPSLHSCSCDSGSLCASEAIQLTGLPPLSFFHLPNPHYSRSLCSSSSLPPIDTLAYSPNSLHAGAWLARILACAGATSISDPDSALAALESNLSAPIGPKTKRWVGALFERESFQQVYGEGLH